MKLFLKTVLPILVLAGGVAAAVVMVKTRPQAARVEPKERPTLVRVSAVEAYTEPVRVPATGVVRAARQLVLQPEVTGRVIEHSPALVPGGLASAGEVLVRVDPRDYELMVKQQRAAVERARFELKLEAGRAGIAEREWELLEGRDGAASEGRDLALRKPHLANARASLVSAQGGLDRARLSVERAELRAPFNAVVLDESIEIGQLVSPASRLATLVGTDEVWVQVSLPIERLSQIALPDAAGGAGALCHIVLDGAEGVVQEREGRVLRVLPDLDPQGRMARLLVSVEDPLGLREAGGGSRAGLSLLLGSYVRVEIEGHGFDGVVRIPRAALRNGDRVWVMNGEDLLEVRDVEVAWRMRDAVLVAAGLAPGDRVVTSRISTPIPGMRLALADAGRVVEAPDVAPDREIASGAGPQPEPSEPPANEERAEAPADHGGGRR